MGLLNLFKINFSKNQYISKAKSDDLRAKQLSMLPVILDNLGQINISETCSIRLEYFFYTNDINKAKKLASNLASLNYQTSVEPSALGDKRYLITGWTSKMQTQKDFMTNWTNMMFDLALEYDCEFDGWGTDGRED